MFLCAYFLTYMLFFKYRCENYFCPSESTGLLSTNPVSEDGRLRSNKPKLMKVLSGQLCDFRCHDWSQILGHESIYSGR